MKSSPLHDWKPDPQLLAAYFDGELENRADLAELRRRLEAWLEQHPEARVAEQANAGLEKLWRETSPREPTSETWNLMLARIDEARRNQPTRSQSKQPWLAAICVAGIALLIGVVWGALRLMPTPPAPHGEDVAHHQEKQIPSASNDMEVLPVATMNEVVILRVEGEDTGLLVVGELPLHGLLELAAPGDIHFVRVQPDAQDNMLPHVRQDGQNPPIIWARTDTEDE